MTNELASIEFASRIARGQHDEHAHQWLQKGFAAWLRCSGTVPLHQCLALPSSESKLERSRRDQWIVTAAACIDARSAWSAANELAAELERFITRGPWRVWCDAKCPPADASQLRSALFYIASANDGKSLSAKQIHRVIGHG